MHFYGNARQKHTKFNELQKAAKVLAARFTPARKEKEKNRRLAAAGNLQPAHTHTQFGATKRKIYTKYIYICKVYVCEGTQEWSAS